MSKFGTGMVPNQYWSTLSLPMLLFPTSKVELLNLIISSGVGNIVPNPPSSEKHFLDFAPPLHQVKPLFDRWVGLLEAFGVWLL
jgi:hypothetical protein